MASSDSGAIDLKFGTAPHAEFADGKFKCQTITIDDSFCDSNGHMNVALYVNIFDRALEEVFYCLGMDQESVVSTGQSHFTIELNVKYQREVLSGQKVSVDYWIVDHSDKVIQFVAQMKHEDGQVAATFEQLTLSVDMTTRRATPTRSNVMDKVVKMKHAETPFRWGALNIRR